MQHITDEDTLPQLLTVTLAEVLAQCNSDVVRGHVVSQLRWVPLRWVVVAVAIALPTAAAAQLQVNQNFVGQGPAPSFGPINTVQSADAPPNGNVAGAVGPVVADPGDVNTLYVGTPAG